MRLACSSAALWLAVGTAGLGVAPDSAFALGKPVIQAEGTRQRVLRSWMEADRVNGQDVIRRKEVVFDYAKGVARESTYDADGKLVASRVMAHNQPAPSADEMAEALAIIQADPKLGRLMSRTQAEGVGYFLLEEPAGQACGPRTRCLQVSLVAQNGLGTLRWLVVDLTKQAIVYANYGSLERERLLRRFWGVQQ